MNLIKEDFYCGAFLSYLLNNKIVPVLFIFICGQLNLSQSKVAVVPMDIVSKCISLDYENNCENQTIKISLIKRSRNFEIYSMNKELRTLVR